MITEHAHTWDRAELTARFAQYRRLYVKLSDGSYVKIARADFATRLNEKRSDDTVFDVLESHETHIGHVLYIVPRSK